MWCEPSVLGCGTDVANPPLFAQRAAFVSAVLMMGSAIMAHIRASLTGIMILQRRSISAGRSSS